MVVRNGINGKFCKISQNMGKLRGDFHGFRFSAWQIQNQERPPGHPLQCPRIDDARLTGAMLLGDMRVPVEHEVECVGMFEIGQQMVIVSVRESERDFREFQLAPGAVQGRPDVARRTVDVVAVVIAIAENDVGVRGK